MKVLVVNNMAPFLWGGAEELANHLSAQLQIAGHQSEILRVPFQWEPATNIPTQMLLARSLEIQNVDRVIAMKFPAYYVRHPEKTLWLLHQYRQAYDLYNTDQSNLPSGAAGEKIREIIVSVDNECFRESKRIFTNSSVTQQRLKTFNDTESTVLLPPVNDPERFLGGNRQGYIFAGGRVNTMKRQHLLVEAMAETAKDVKLLIAGPPELPEDKTRLEKLVEQLDLADRVKLDLRFLPRETYADYLNGANAVAYLPYDEDSLGYVAMEAATAAKPIITTSDSGGITQIVEHGVTGWVSELDKQSLGRVMSDVFRDASRARELGQSAKRRWLKLDVTWPKTIQRLLHG